MRTYYIYTRRVPGPLVVEATEVFIDEGNLVLRRRGDVVARAPSGSLVLDEDAYKGLTDAQRGVLNVDPGPPPPPPPMRRVYRVGGGFPLLAWHHLLVAGIAFGIGWASAFGRLGGW